MSRALKVKLFPSQEIKASKNIQCLQSSSGNHRFQYGKRTMMRNFHSTVAKFEDIHRNESKVTTPPSSDPTVNARLLDNVIIIENDLSSLIKEEVKEIKENFKQSVAKLHSQFLSPSFSFTEKGTNGLLQITTKDRKGKRVEVEWDLRVVPKMEEADLSTEILNASEDQQINTDDDQKGEVSQDGEIDFDLNPKTSSADVNFDVRINHQSNEVCIRCTAGVDSRLYILSLSKSPSDESIEVNDLSEELQQRLYDYLEELSISDLIACYIRQYNILHRNNKQAHSLQTLLPYFSK